MGNCCTPLILVGLEVIPPIHIIFIRSFPHVPTSCRRRGIRRKSLVERAKVCDGTHRGNFGTEGIVSAFLCFIRSPQSIILSSYLVRRYSPDWLFPGEALRIAGVVMRWIDGCVRNSLLLVISFLFPGIRIRTNSPVNHLYTPHSS